MTLVCEMARCQLCENYGVPEPEISLKPRMVAPKGDRSLGSNQLFWQLLWLSNYAQGPQYQPLDSGPLPFSVLVQGSTPVHARPRPSTIFDQKVQVEYGALRQV